MFECKLRNECEINIKTRHQCQSCRLNKCFQFGMSTDLFRAARINKRSNFITIQKQRQTHILLPTLNLLERDQSLLNADQ